MPKTNLPLHGNTDTCNLACEDWLSVIVAYLGKLLFQLYKT